MDNLVEKIQVLEPPFSSTSAEERDPPKAPSQDVVHCRGFAPIEKLPNDVLSLICEKLSQCSLGSLLSLCVVSRAMYYAGAPHRYRHCMIDFSYKNSPPPQHPTSQSCKGLRLSRKASGHEKPGFCCDNCDRTLRMIKTIMTDSSRTFILTHIRSITLTDKSFPYDWRFDVGKKQEGLEDRWQLISDFLKRVVRLEHLEYNCSSAVPFLLVETLNKHHPKARLHVVDWVRRNGRTPHDDSAEIALANSPQLQTFALCDRNSRNDYTVKASFSRTLKLAPNLKHIRYTTWAFQGCVRYWPEPGPWCPDSYASPEVETKLAKLEKFQVEDPVMKQIVELKLRTMPLDIGAFDCYWSQFIDFGRLEVLDVALETDLLRRCAESNPFRELKKLYLAGPSRTSSSEELVEFDRAAAAFINTCSLTGLAVAGQFSVASILESQSKTLQFLYLHRACGEWRGSNIQRPQTDSWLLGLIRDQCQLLNFLAIDINQTLDRKQEQEIYTTLSRIPQVGTIRLHYNMGVALFEETSGQFPKIDEEFARGAWKAICDNKEGKPLTQLALRVGELPQPLHNMGWMDTTPPFEQYSSWLLTGDINGVTCVEGEDLVWFDGYDLEYSWPSL